jgi:putative hemolysin
MSEIALVSARKGRLEAMANKGDAKAKAALHLAENLRNFIYCTNRDYPYFHPNRCISGEKFSENLKPVIEKIAILKPYASTLSTVLIVMLVTFLSIIVGELIPKRMGMLRAEKIARVVAGPINVLSAITYPIIWLLNLISNLFFKIINIKPASDNAVTEEEIKAMITEEVNMAP